MTAPTISTLPTAPTPDLPREQFDIIAAAWVAALDPLVSEINAFGDWLDEGNFVAPPSGFTATDLATTTVPGAMLAFVSSGYTTAGIGPGLYVNDSLAGASLAAAHPRFCKLSADGRYWRLSVESGLNVLAAGAVGDNSTDDGSAFTDAIAYLKYFATLRASIGYGKGSPRLFVPAMNFYLGTSTLEFKHTMIFEGDNGGKFAGGGATLRWADNTTGIRTHMYNTTGETATDTDPTNLGSPGMIIRNLYLRGGFTSTESESHGIHLRCPVHLENMTIDNFGGDGIFANANAVPTLPTYPGGQSNGSTFVSVSVLQCRNGYYFDGFDSNALNFFNCDANSNRRYGAWHKMALSVNWFGGNFSTNGDCIAIPTICTYGSRWYYVLPGQESGASTNSPKGSIVTITIASPGVVTWNSHGLSNGTVVRFSTTGALPTGIVTATDYYVVNAAANTFQVSATYGGSAINTSGSQSGVHKCGASVANTWWAPMDGNGYVASSRPAWTSGLTWRSGGSFRADGVGQQGALHNTYVEGDQPWPQAEGPWFCSGRQLRTFDGSVHAGQLIYDTTKPKFGNSLELANSLFCRGNAYFGPEVGTAPADALNYINNTNVYSVLYFQQNGVTVGFVASYFDQLQLNADAGGVLQDGGTSVATWSTSGLLVPLSGAKVGYTTGAGGAVTQATSRTTGVTLNKACGQITLVSAAGTASWQTFTVTNSVVEAGDVVRVVQKSGTDKNMIHVTAVAAGSFDITFATTGGTTTEQPVFTFAVEKAVAA